MYCSHRWAIILLPSLPAVFLYSLVPLIYERQLLIEEVKVGFRGLWDWVGFK